MWPNCLVWNKKWHYVRLKDTNETIEAHSKLSVGNSLTDLVNLTCWWIVTNIKLQAPSIWDIKKIINKYNGCTQKLKIMKWDQIFFKKWNFNVVSNRIALKKNCKKFQTYLVNLKFCIILQSQGFKKKIMKSLNFEGFSLENPVKGI